MKFYTHIAGGLLLYVFLVWMFNQPLNLVGIMAVCCVSVIPDILDRLVGEHRSWGHSAVLLIPIILSFLISIWFGLALFSGFMAHILFDIMTKKGVAFLYPFSKTRYVMPKKEKSRIITGSKQEKALFIVVILLFIPVSYGVIHGFDDLAGALGADDHSNKTTNKTNKTNKTGNNFLNSLSKKATSDLRSSSPYPKTPTKYIVYIFIKNENKTDTEQDLIDWLDNNQVPIDEAPTNNTNNTNSTLNDVLFEDMSSNTDNLAAGESGENDMTMGEESSNYIPEGYKGVNPDDGYGEDSEVPGFFFLIGSLTMVLGGGALVK